MRELSFNVSRRPPPGSAPPYVGSPPNVRQLEDPIDTAIFAALIDYYRNAVNSPHAPRPIDWYDYNGIHWRTVNAIVPEFDRAGCLTVRFNNRGLYIHNVNRAGEASATRDGVRAWQRPQLLAQPIAPAFIPRPSRRYRGGLRPAGRVGALGGIASLALWRKKSRPS
jgi:hypothetical protein